MRKEIMSLAGSEFTIISKDVDTEKCIEAESFYNYSSIPIQEQAWLHTQHSISSDQIK